MAGSDICKRKGYHVWTDKQGRIADGGSVGETYEDMDMEMNCTVCGATCSGTLYWSV